MTDYSYTLLDTERTSTPSTLSTPSLVDDGQSPCSTEYSHNISTPYRSGYFEASALLLRTRDYVTMHGCYVLPFALALIEGCGLSILPDKATVMCHVSGIYKFELTGKLKSSSTVEFKIEKEVLEPFNTLVVGNKHIRGAVLYLPLSEGETVKCLLVPEKPTQVIVYPQTLLAIYRIA